MVKQTILSFLMLFVVFNTSCATERMLLEEEVIRGTLIFSEFIGEINHTDGGLVKDYYEFGRIYENWEGDATIDVENIFYLSRNTIQQMILTGYLRAECFNEFLIYRLGNDTEYAIVRSGKEKNIDVYRVTLGNYEECSVF